MKTTVLKKQNTFWLIFAALCFFAIGCWPNNNEENGDKKPSIPSVAHCNNGLYDGDETGIDCGGKCPTDCCQNKKLDANLGETGIDCGGKCPACDTIPKPPLPKPNLNKELEKDFNELAKEKDRKKARDLVEALNEKYKKSQIIVSDKKEPYTIIDYTKNLVLQAGTNIQIEVQDIQENEGKLITASIKEIK